MTTCGTQYTKPSVITRHFVIILLQGNIIFAKYWRNDRIVTNVRHFCIRIKHCLDNVIQTTEDKCKTYWLWLSTVLRKKSSLIDIANCNHENALEGSVGKLHKQINIFRHTIFYCRIFLLCVQRKLKLFILLNKNL